MEAKLSEELSKQYQSRYEVVANNSIIQANNFFQIFDQLIHRQSIIVSQVLNDDISFTPGQEKNGDKVHPLNSQEGYIGELNDELYNNTMQHVLSEDELT